MEALQAHRIADAAIDLFDEEPLHAEAYIRKCAVSLSCRAEGGPVSFPSICGTRKSPAAFESLTVAG